MSGPVLNRRWLVHNLPVILVVGAIGALHRRALPDAMVDDRALVHDPAWFQLAAPFWHAALSPSPSLAHRLTQLIDPLTAASTAGDMRAVAAIAAALSGGAVLVLLRTMKVPLVIAIPLCGALAGGIVPVAVVMSPAHALQMLLGLSALLCVVPTVAPSWSRLVLLAAITIVGAANHVSFIAFAAALWGVLYVAGDAASRKRVATAGALSLTIGVWGGAALLHASVSAAGEAPITAPSVSAIVIGLLTGRFTAAMQPVLHGSVLANVLRSIPSPLVVAVPLAVIGLWRRETRRVALTCAVAALALVVFNAGSWLPDMAVASAPARVAVLPLIALGLLWVFETPVRGSMALAVVASASIGLYGWVLPDRFETMVANARMQAFVESGAAAIAESAWTTDRLAVARALLLSNDALQSSRMAARLESLDAVPEERNVLIFGDGLARRSGNSLALAPIELRYRSATSFLSSLRDWAWLAVAVRIDRTSDFCRDLVARLGGEDALSRSPHVTLLSQVGNGRHPTTEAAAERLDILYGRTLGENAVSVPAHFVIETDPEVRITINGRLVARASEGAVAAIFDPWTLDSSVWVSPRCDSSDAPAMLDPPFRAGYWIGPDIDRELPRIPVVNSEREHVRLGYDGNAWFGEGWHEPEGGDTPFRWTKAHIARLNVIVSRRQPLRVRIAGDLASAPGMANGMELSWNDAVIRPLGVWDAVTESQWTVPADLVRRGLNVMTLRVAHVVAPAAGGASNDPRTLGARITEIVFEPEQ